MSDDEGGKGKHDHDANHQGQDDVKRSKQIKLKGGKGVAAQIDLSQQMWLSDGEGALRSMLAANGALSDAFVNFVKLEGGESEVAFYKDVLVMQAISDEDEKESKVSDLYERYMGDVSNGIGAQQRTGATAKMYSTMKKKKVKTLSPAKMEAALVKEASGTLKGLAFNAFPRFVKSKACKTAMTKLKAGDKDAGLASALEGVGSSLPQDADEWLASFCTLAETWPACIVISDMSIPGAPMVFVNPEFCRVTQYAKEDAIGRNCRFLQGPETEPEAIQVIQQTLAKGEDCHVLLTNYRRSGEKFKNLLSMRPVFDADGLYRYVIGVQFEVEKNGGEPARLAQLNKLLQMLPSKLDLRSSTTARKRGMMASSVQGAPAAKDEDGAEALEAEKAQAMAEIGETGEPRDWTKAIFALTRVMWMENGESTMKGLLASKKTAKSVEEFAVATGSTLVCTHVRFMMDALSVEAGDHDALRRLFMVRHHNAMYYCSRQEINYGELDYTDWDGVSQEVARAVGTSAKFLAAELLPSLMRSSAGVKLVKTVRKGEASGGTDDSPKKKKKSKKKDKEGAALVTCANGVSDALLGSDRYWLEMFGNVAASFSSVGIVVSDMRVPGIPLTYVNDGFAKVTGYSKDYSTGKKCSFLQGEDTQMYLVDEILAALRESKALLIKIVNYKKDKSMFQCLFALHPVFGDDGEYLYQVGAQLDMSMKDTGKLCAQLESFERLLQLMPTGLSCSHATDKMRDMIPKSLGGDASFSALPAPVEHKLTAEVAAEAPPVETGVGANKDMYGKQMGKKHKNVLAELSKSAWLTDADKSLTMLLETEAGRTGFGSFLEAEYNKASLDFYIAFKGIEKLGGDELEAAAANVFKSYMGAPDASKKKGKGIGSQDRTKATDKLWNKNASKEASGKKKNMFAAVKKEANDTFKMLVVESFPRFLDSKWAKSLSTAAAGGKDSKQLKEALERAGSSLPQDADEWLKGFTGIAETWPACIVVSDMSISGAPMVYVNPEFCRVTEYEQEDAVGRNCRFLQGPETEPEAIGVIQRTLAKGEDCHVLLTNYRKSGDKFKNLLSMRPVFDADGVYRYVIGVQFEVIEDENLNTRMTQLDKLLNMLPRRLPFRSVAKVQTAPLADKKKKDAAPSEEEHLHSIFAATKAKWLLSREETLAAMMDDAEGVAAFGAFVKETCGVMAQSAVRFILDTQALAAAKASKKNSMARDMHLKMGYNDLFYCTQTEITIGKIDDEDWGKIVSGVEAWRGKWLSILGATCLGAFLDSRRGGDLLVAVRKREAKKPSAKGLSTVAKGLALDSPTFWLEMMQRVGNSMHDVGFVISDMRVPGIPLSFINEEGFKKVTGYGREMEMQKCNFLQGKASEPYLIEEIVDTLRGMQPLVVKLKNHKKGGEMFPCLLVIVPIFDTSGEYGYTVGMQLNCDNQEEDPDDVRYVQQLSLISTVARLLPMAKVGHLPPPSMTGARLVTEEAQVPIPVRERRVVDEDDEAPAHGGEEEAAAKGDPRDANHQGQDDVKRSKQIKLKGGKGVAAQIDLSQQMWLSDGEGALRSMLAANGALSDAFVNFVKLEGGESEVAFYKDVLVMQAISDEDEKESKVSDLYERYMGDVSNGIGAQQRTGATAKMYSTMKKKKVKTLSPAKMEAALVKEASGTLKGLAFNAFPRFVKSKACKTAMTKLKAGDKDAGLASALEGVGSSLPQDADEWLASFCTLAETWPACIVISDMSIPGAPMVFVNPEFCRVTQYAKEDAIGRNCRFLQGPETEPEAIQVIQQTLAKGEDCHVLLTNYRRSGEKFKNLLSMRPVFDADGLYRYVIGVQFEVEKNGGEPARLAQLNKLLQMLPSKLDLRSSTTARKRGMMASSVQGAPAAKDEDGAEALEAEKAQAMAEIGETGEPRDWTKAIFALTRVMWMENGESTMKGLLASKKTAKSVEEFAVATGSTLVCTHVRFMMDALSVEAGDHDALRRLFMVRHHNAMYYCSRQEINYGELDYTDWDGVSQEVARAVGTSAKFLAAELLPSLMRSSAGVKLVKTVRKGEASGGTDDSPKKKKKSKKKDKEGAALVTCANGVSDALLGSDRYWLEMFGNVAASFSSVGIVVSDMRVPGIPLTYVNDGFAKVTGYSKDYSTGKKCSFLQGEDTQMYLVDEILAALRESKALLIKIVNYKKDKSMFQCLFALHPVFGDDGEYLYQVGAQLDMSMKDTGKLCAQLESFERLLQLMPTGLSCSHATDKMRDMIPKSLGGDASFSALPAPVEHKLTAEVAAEAPPVETGVGANKDMYGKQMGKKHKNVLAELSKSAWLTDADKSLTMLLETEAGRTGFGSFLEAEYNKASLDFYIAFKGIEKLGGDELEAAAANVFKSYMGAPDASKKKGKGIGSQDRTKATDKLWNKNASKEASGKKKNMFAAVKKEANDTFKMLVVESFPRFLDSKWAKSLSTAAAGGKDSKQLKEALERAGSSLPQDADEWLKGFTGIAETWPACIVVSDMSISGAPMVYVNPEFCRVTEYEQEDAVGRNCRFLQGPETEPEAIGVIQRTLAKGEDCHVLLTNYRKSGDKFKNLLSMRPVFDADGVYRYVIGVQFEVIEDENLNTRMTQLDKLLNMLPRRLPFRSVAKVQTAPLADKKKKDAAPSEEEHLHSIFAATKAKWLLSREETLAAMMDDAEGVAAFGAFVKETCGVMAQSAVRFILDTQALAAAKASKKNSMARDMHLKMGYNDLFYCTQTEITIGKIDDEDWGKIVSGVEAWRGKWLSILGATCLGAFLDSRRGGDLLVAVRKREAKKPSAKGLSTVAKGLALDSPTFWLEMMQRVGNSMHDVGFVISDMRVPGIPLSFINEEGFKKVTGYGREMEMQKCNFLQGKASEPYLIEEIVDTLRGMQPLVVKLKNHKKGGEMFPCLLVIVPIFDTSGEYGYTVGMQLNCDNQEEDPDDVRYVQQLSLISTVARLLPMAKVGHLPPPSMAGARLVTEEATAPAGGAAAGWPTPRGEKSLKEDDASDDDSDHASKKKKKKKKAVVSSDEEDDEPRSPPSKHPDKLRRSVQESPMDEPHTPSRPKGSKKKGSGSLPTRIAAAEVHLLGAASKGAFLPRLEALEEAAGIEDPAENTGDRIEAIEAAM